MANNVVSDEEFENKESCRTYLLTYSKADLSVVPNQRAFTDIVLEAFSIGSAKVIVEHWATCTENHADGEHQHYHMALKLSGTRRWRPLHQHIYKTRKISVNFSSKSYGYLAAYRYVCKDKPYESVLHSTVHPNLKDAKSPVSKRGFTQSSQNSKKRQCSEGTPLKAKSTPAKRRLSNSEVAKFLVENDIKTDTHLMSVANQRQSEDQPDLFNFILNKSSKSLSELICVTWKMHSAPKTIERQHKCRLDLVVETADTACIEGCNGTWLVCARQVLKNNNINIYVFADALRECLKRGRKKNNNILLTGPTNCGKSFLLNPVELIFNCFVNPASGKYAWVGLDECELAYLNDFRWSAELIAWNEFLLLLEGQTVHLPRPKKPVCHRHGYKQREFHANLGYK